MLSTDEDAVICDLAETYQIYNYKDMPPDKVAIFCNGLRDDSRIKLKMADQKVKLDKLSLLVWTKTKDGQKGRNKPKSLVDSINKHVKVKEELVFTTGEEFERERNRILKKGG